MYASKPAIAALQAHSHRPCPMPYVAPRPIAPPDEPAPDPVDSVSLSSDAGEPEDDGAACEAPRDSFVPAQTSDPRGEFSAPPVDTVPDAQNPGDPPASSEPPAEVVDLPETPGASQFPAPEAGAKSSEPPAEIVDLPETQGASQVAEPGATNAPAEVVDLPDTSAPTVEKPPAADPASAPAKAAEQPPAAANAPSPAPPPAAGAPATKATEPAKADPPATSSFGDTLNRLASSVGNSLDDWKKSAQITAGKQIINQQVDKEFEKFKIPDFKETGITDQSTSEDMTNSQFNEFKKVERFAHNVISEGRKGGSAHIPDLSRIQNEQDKLKAIFDYETHTQVQERYGKAIKHGVMGSLDSYLSAGERYGNARFLADALNESKDFSKQIATDMLTSYTADPAAFLRQYEQKYSHSKH